jgi:hypothetical protein
MGNPKDLRVVILLDMGADDSWMRRITMPVDLSEYPDAHQARSLAVRLEMVGHEGSDHAMRTVEMHGGLGSSLIDGQCSDAQKTYQRIRLDRNSESSSQSKHQHAPLWRGIGMRLRNVLSFALSKGVASRKISSPNVRAMARRGKLPF